MRFADYTDHSVTLAVDLVNTHSPLSGREDLARVEDLAAFLEEHGIKPAHAPNREELEQLREIRERIREVFEAPDGDVAAAAVNRILETVHASPYLSDHDGEAWHLHYAPTEAPVARHLAATAAVGLAVVVAEDGVDRLGVCEWERCRDVFVDTSKNRSRRYCDPATCGNRASAAAYRARQRSRTAPG